MRPTISLGLLVVCIASVAQSQTLGCAREIPQYNQWTHEQKLPYMASEQRLQELTINYPKMDLGMSQQQTMGILGSPDYAVNGSPNPLEITCVWGYAVEDSGNVGTAKHRGILVAFDGNGEVVNLEPSGLPGLKQKREIDESCKRDLTDYKGWFQQTSLPAGKPYSVAADRKAEFVKGYSKLSLGMTQAETQTILGKPDFEEMTPLGAPKNIWAPKQMCLRQFAYVASQTSDNMVDPDNVGIILSFDEKGKLFWAAPQNLEGLKPLGGPRL